ncbi:MAG: DUF3592 domain-containing protein [Clostridia bacterium]|nr:DUF3592 domain-containing protein [Clostridia bacterium]
MTVKTVLLSGAAVLFCAAALWVLLFVMLMKKRRAKRTAGRLFSATDCGNRYSRLRYRSAKYIKTQSQAKYRYIVDGKDYYLKEVGGETAQGASKMVSVVYLTCFPRAAYIDEQGSITKYKYILFAFLSLLLSGAALLAGLLYQVE